MTIRKWVAEGKYLVAPSGMTVGEIDLDKVDLVVAKLNQAEDTRKKVYHGWVVCEEVGEEYNDVVYVEFNNGMNARQRTEVGRGNAGCTLAMEFFDSRVGQSVQLEPTIRGCYRVFTYEKG